MKIYIILVNHNKSKLTENCIKSFPIDNSIIFLVIDNSSCVNDRLEMKKKVGILQDHRKVHLFFQENKGFGAACNYGIKKILSKKDKSIVWLLNNDCEILSKNVISEIKSSVIDEKTIYGTTQINSHTKKVLCTAGGIICYSILDQRQLNNGTNINEIEYFDSEEIDKKLDFINGGSLIASSQLFRSYKVFDEDYFLYWEDTCYTHRLKQVNNINLKWIRTINVLHHAGSSTNHESLFTEKLYLKNRLKFFKKNYPHIKYQKVYIYFLFILSKIKKLQFSRIKLIYAN